MLKTYLKVAFRAIWKNKTTSLINILGLSIGIAACLVIWQYVDYEKSYDQFFSEAGQVVRINTLWRGPEGKERYATTAPPLAEAIENNVPEAAAVTRLYHWSDFTMRPDDNFEKVFRETKVYITDHDFFKVFDFELLEVDETAVQEQMGAVVLPKSTAVRYFGEEAVANRQVVGRFLQGGKDAGTPWKVAAVMQDVPENSHFDFDFLIIANNPNDDIMHAQNWSWPIMYTYLRLQEGTQASALQPKLNDLAERFAIPNLGESIEEFQELGYAYELPTQSLTDIHLHSSWLREMKPNSNATYINTLSIIALFIILIACINYINLFTAQSTIRAKEVGVKKVIGARKSNLMGQFLLESFVFSSLAVGLALGLSELVQTFSETVLGQQLCQPTWSMPQLLLTSLGILVGVTLLAGAYPAFYLTQFRPLQVLKSKFGGTSRRSGLRDALVVFQFVISIGLIASTFVVNQQVKFFQSKQLGYDKENLLVIQNDREIEEQRLAFKQQLERHPGVRQASFTTGIPGLQQYQVRDFRLEGQSSGQGIGWHQIDEDYLPTMGIELLAGRNFSNEIAADTFGLILNQAAVELLGLENPVGQYVIKNQGMPDQQRLQIIGVVQDFHLESLHHEIKPMAMQYLTDFVFKDYAVVRLAPGNIPQTITHIKDQWSTFEPGVPITYSFLDDNLDQLFRAEQRLGQIFSLFTTLALFIACLGLYGLALFTLERRRKEISIRKVIGATLGDLLLLLNRNFLRLTLIAFALATPLAWLAMRNWLQNFAYRIDMPWWVFLLAGLLAIGIGLLTVSLQSLRAVRSNPIDALKDE